MIACEDIDLCARMQQAGYRIYEARAVRAVHAGGDRTLGIFFRKHAWRSMGMFGMLKNEPLNKPVVITFLHLLLCMIALGNLFATLVPLYLRFSYFLFLVNLAPAVTILYRLANEAPSARPAPGDVPVRRLFYCSFLCHVEIGAFLESVGRGKEQYGGGPARLIPVWLGRRGP